MRALLYWVACASTLGCVRLYIKLCALLYWVACASILGCYIGFVCFYIRLCALLYMVVCATLMLALVYCTGCPKNRGDLQFCSIYNILR